MKLALAILLLAIAGCATPIEQRLMPPAPSAPVPMKVMGWRAEAQTQVTIRPAPPMAFVYPTPLQNCRVWESPDLRTWTDVTENAEELQWVLNDDGTTWDVQPVAKHGRMYFRVSGEAVNQ